MTFAWNRTEAPAVGALFAPAAAGPQVGAPAAADSPQRVKAGALLGDLYGYLRANALDHPALAAAIPVLSSAVAEYRTGQAADPVAGVRAVYAAIETARRSDPTIPEA
jgi:hypothetical protein